MPEHTAKVTVGENGRLVLPAPFRKALGLTGTGQVVLTLEGDEVRVTSLRQRLLDARARFRRFVPQGQGMVDALLEERGAEEAQEDADLGLSGAPVEPPPSGSNLGRPRRRLRPPCPPA